MIKYNVKKELNSGFTSRAFLLDDKFIQLVGKNENAVNTYKDLKANSELLKGKITCVDYPNNMQLFEPSITYPYGSLVYSYVKGKPVNPNNLTEQELTNLAKKLVEFNNQMHNLDVHWNRENAINHEVNKVNVNIELLKNYLTESEICLLKNYALAFSNYLNSKPKFCMTHGDLWADNLIVDSNNNLTGIIDFGNMAYFLPEVDYASVWNMCDGFLDKMIEFSNEDITKESVNLFIVHRELCFFEYVLNCDVSEVNCQLDKIKETLKLIEPQLSKIKQK